jgi:hypothetical protein
MRRLLRVGVLGLAVVFALLALPIPHSASQVRKNRTLLADMQDAVNAIKQFQRDSGRLPNAEELTEIEKRLPRRYSLPYAFHFGAPPAGPEEHLPSEARNGGWILWYWRGEWAEWYTSWDDHYSLAEQTSLWRFCGPLIAAPFGAVLFLALGSLPYFRRKPAEPSKANALPVQ